MRQGIVGLAAVFALSAAAGSAMADGRILFGVNPGRVGSTGNQYDGSDGAGGAFVITTRGGYNGKLGDNRVSNDTSNSINFVSDRRTVDAGGADLSFLSFCIERNEYIAGMQEYWTQISTSASLGGAGGGNGQTDPLSPVTAWIYREFRRIGADGNTTGLFNGALGTSLSQAETSAIQTAIWYSEGEVTTISGTAAAIYNYANNPLRHNNSLSGVRVLRLWETRTGTEGNYSYGGQHQDQLTLIPLPPAAWAGLSTLAGVGFVGYIRRRKNTAQ